MLNLNHANNHIAILMFDSPIYELGHVVLGPPDCFYDFSPKDLPSVRGSDFGKDRQGLLERLHFQKFAFKLVMQNSDFGKIKSSSSPFNLESVWRLVQEDLPSFYFGTIAVLPDKIVELIDFMSYLIPLVKSGQIAYNEKKYSCVTVSINVLKKLNLINTIADVRSNYWPDFFMRYLIKIGVFAQIQERRLEYNIEQDGEAFSWTVIRDIDNSTFPEHEKFQEDRKRWNQPREFSL